MTELISIRSMRRRLNRLDVVEAGRKAVARRPGSELGQTPTEYLMIVGIMAAVILIAFVAYFWPEIQGAAKSWTKQASGAVKSSEGLETSPTP